MLGSGLLAPAAAAAQEPPEPPSRAHGSTVARIVAPGLARAELDSPKRGWKVHTTTAWSAQPQVLLVLDSAIVDGRDWVKLLLADRPNGSAGWVRRDGVVLGRTRYWVTVHVRTPARACATRSGSARSHGCVRVDNDDVRWMARKVPAGTPVRVRR